MLRVNGESFSAVGEHGLLRLDNMLPTSFNSSDLHVRSSAAFAMTLVADHPTNVSCP